MQQQALPDTLGELFKALRMILDEGGILTAELEARLIIEKRAGYQWADLIAKPLESVGAQALALIFSDVQERLAGKPLSRIYGEREFWGLDFEVTLDVLDPRPDTETILDIALQRFDRKKSIEILDLGTGSGCILIALLSEFTLARGLGADISPAALEVAKKNALLNGVENRSEWILSNWFDSVQDGRKFDLIVSNPPYIRESVIPDLEPEVRNFDPILALDGGEDGLRDYKKIFSSLFSYLKPDGIALFEIGFDQAEDVMRLGGESRFDIVNVHPDLAGLARVVEISCGDK